MNDIHSRIKERRLELQLTREQLGDMVGVSYQTIGKWETPDAEGGTAPQRNRLQIVAARLKTSAAWLLTGNSDNVKDQGVSKYAFIRPYRSTFQQETPVKRHHEIPALNDDEESYAYRIDWMQKHGFEQHNCVVVLADDNAMELGDQRLVDTSRKQIVSGQPYALDGKAGVRVRRLFVRYDGQIILRADNEAFPEEVAQPQDLHIIGQVVAFSGVVPAP